jgi:hypothetical protein
MRTDEQYENAVQKDQPKLAHKRMFTKEFNKSNR